MTTDGACARATMASVEVIRENCEGVEGDVEEVADGVFAFIADERKQEMDFEPGDPQSQEEIEQAIESCMTSEWASDWADSVLGPDASADTQEQTRRRACEGLFS